MSKYKIMVTYVEAGMGHIVSAEAVANALETYYPDEVEIDRSYIFEETGNERLLHHEKYLINEVKRSNRHPVTMSFLFFLIKVFPPQTSLLLAYSLAFGRVKKDLIRIMNEHDPDMVFSTHFTPLHCSVRAKKHGADFLSAVYDPDPNVHGWWDRNADLMAVNNEAAYREAIKHGFKPEKTLGARFVVRTKVQETPKDKALLREKYGLPPDNFTVVMAAGAYAEGHLPEFALRFLQISRKFTLLVVAGKNDKVYDDLTARIGQNPLIDLRVYRFQPDIHELYGAADLFVTKAGPNAILDSVYMGTPVMVNFYASPIEKTTKELYVDRHATGVYTDEPDKAAALLESYIDDPALLDVYRENCRVFCENCIGGEKMIADRIMEELKKHGAPKADRAAGQ